jgi:hypothetical protein
MPYERATGQDAPEPQRLAFQAFREVRHTVIRVITAHLEDDAAVSWQGLNFDFTGAVFDGGDFSDAEFSGGSVMFTRARFSGDRVGFSNVRFSGGDVSFIRAQFSGGTVGFNNAWFSGGNVYFIAAEFSSSLVDFGDARFSGGSVMFIASKFFRGRVPFTGARFSGGKVSFAESEFSGSAVDFSKVVDWSFPPAFPLDGHTAPRRDVPQKGRLTLLGVRRYRLLTTLRLLQLAALQGTALKFPELCPILGDSTL